VTGGARAEGEDARIAVLHALRVKGAATVEDAARITGTEAAAELAALQADGLASGQGEYFMATPTGLEQDAEHSRARLGDGAAALAAIYDERFLAVNVRFKAVATAWQERGEQIELIEEAADVHDVVTAVLADTAPYAPHLSRYAERLDASMQDFLGGDAAALTAAVGVSYHNTWFELHEDFIATLGRSREKETA
jgi:hypothetical protein